MAALIMAQHSKSNNAITASASQQQQLQEKPMFHDFLGMKPTDSPVGLGQPNLGDARLSEVSPSASASVGASSDGGRGPLSTTSDMGSVERQVGSHLEGVPFYSPRSDISGFEISNRLVGSKRSNSDSAFIGSSRDGIAQMGHDSLESSHLMKILKNGPGGERSKGSNDEDVFIGMQSLRPTSASFILQPPTGSRIDAYVSKWERSIPMNASPTVQYPPRGGQFLPFMHQLPTNRFKDGNAGPSIISQSAADEGSRTGIKGPGILSSINSSGDASERNSSGLLPSSSRTKSGTRVSEPESSTPPSRSGSISVGRQMTIFYGGQAHVFDDVHPNKADVIIALAGSNGGSWSTVYLPKSAQRQVSECYMPCGENETGMASTMAFPREFRGLLPVTGSSSLGLGSDDRISTPAVGHQGSILAKETRNTVQAAERSVDEKR